MSDRKVILNLEKELVMSDRKVILDTRSVSLTAIEQDFFEFVDDLVAIRDSILEEDLYIGGVSVDLDVSIAGGDFYFETAELDISYQRRETEKERDARLDAEARKKAFV